MLVNALIQAKAIGDKKMQLSQQMLDAAERQAKKLKLAHQKYGKTTIQVHCRSHPQLSVESTTQQANPAEPNSNELDSDTDYESETRSMSNKTSTTSLWKRRATTNTNANSTLNLKRKCVANAEHPTDRKKMAQRNANATSQNSASTNGKRIKLNNDSGSTPSDEPTYCLCSQVTRRKTALSIRVETRFSSVIFQLSYGSMILCDNKACEIKWFHFNCVDLTTKPKGKWFCPNCAKSRKHVSM